ncbi:hypothetical protein ACWENQ_17165 [Nonomuraea sp. NPDC004354]
MLVAVLAAGAVVVLTRPWGRADGAPATGEPRAGRTAHASPRENPELTGKVARTAAAVTTERTGHAGSFGSWIAGDLFVRTDATGVIARAAATGEPRWTAIVMRVGTHEDPLQPYRLKLADGPGGAMGPA